jgi:three-Cys-motif partner protein
MAFFDARKAPAVVKHGLLRRYCPAFAMKAGSQTSGLVTFLDGYAGAGCYDDETPGSPLVLANAARKVAHHRQVDAVFVEKNEPTFSRLEQVLAKRCRDQSYTALPGDVDEHLDQIILRCRNRALFAFFDPFGPALSRDRLTSLLRARASASLPTDVLLHVSVRSVWNFGSRLTKAKREGNPLSSQDKSLARHLDRFLGHGWWRTEFEDAAADPADKPDGEFRGERPAATALRVAHTYAEQIGNETGYRTISMPVRRRPRHAPIFILSLFTLHPDGAWLFADCIGQAGLDWEEAWQEAEAQKEGADGTLALFSAAGAWKFDRKAYERAHREMWVDRIARNIDNLLDEYQPLVLADHVTGVFDGVLGTGARSQHARDAVKRLYAADEVDHDGKGDYFYRDRMSRPTQRRPSALAG